MRREYGEAENAEGKGEDGAAGSGAAGRFRSPGEADQWESAAGAERAPAVCQSGGESGRSVSDWLHWPDQGHRSF